MNITNNNQLKKTGSRVPFTVPDNYFQDFAADIHVRISSESVPIKKMIKPWMYMAAMFVGFFILANVLYSIFQGQHKLDDEMYEMYVMSQMDDTILFDYYYDETTYNEYLD